MNVALPAVLIAFLGLLFTIRRILLQVGSASLLSVASMRGKHLLTLLDPQFHCDPERRPSDILEALEFLNIVAKLYLNSCINLNMMRTYEPEVLRLLRNPLVTEEYGRILESFRRDPHIGEPPYINLIYVAHILLRLNSILRGPGGLSYYRSLTLAFVLKLKFRWWPDRRPLWHLCEAAASNTLFPCRPLTSKRCAPRCDASGKR